MRLIYLGTPACAVFPLEDILALAPSHHCELVGVVSREAQLVGRGKKKNLQDPAVAHFAKNLAVPVLQPASARDPDFLEQLRALKPDLLITCAYGQILSDEFLAIPSRGTINIHPSLLPKFRGATPVQTALLQGEPYTGVTILFTVKQLDAGAIISQKIFPIAPGETAGELQDRLFKSLKPLLNDAFNKLRDPDFAGMPQDPSLVSLCRRIKKEFGQIEWSQAGETLINAYRAYAPWPGSFSFYQGKRVVFSQICSLPEEHSFPEGQEPGSFCFDQASGLLVVQCGAGLVGVSSLQREGGSLASAGDFWHGLKSPSAPCFSMMK